MIQGPGLSFKLIKRFMSSYYDVFGIQKLGSPKILVMSHFRFSERSTFRDIFGSSFSGSSQFFLGTEVFG